LQTGNATVSASRLFTESHLSKPPRPPNAKMTSYTGIFLLVFSVLVVVLDFANFFAIAISFFIMLIGIMLVMMGAMGGFETKPEAAPSHTEVVREIVKVRCKYCNALNFETSQSCSNCGAHL
jgi:hypothetical protein